MRVGTRESRLAMRQTEIFVERMATVNPGTECEVIGMKALGDIDLVSRLDEMTGTGAFVRELDDAIMSGNIDCSVNSLKDIPVTMDDRLVIAAMFPRDNPRDVVLPCPLEDLPPGAKVGTSSIRRERQVHSARPDLQIIPLRGNIHTRLDRLDNGDYDAIILAKAGLDRMGIDRPMHTLDEKVFIPAPAQGIIAVECRSDDKETIDMLSRLDDKNSRIEADVERTIMDLMEAGCSSPVGINAKVSDGQVHVNAVSYGFTDEPRHVSIDIPLGYGNDDLLSIAEYLVGKKEVLE